MKKILTLSLALMCLSLSTISFAPAKATPVARKAAMLDFPRGIEWQINYSSGLPMVSLVWPAFSQGGLGPVPFTFMGVTQYINPTTTTSIYWAGTQYTLQPNVIYTMNIAGVIYSFKLGTSGSGWCVITGHT
ncbi:hypothetical protein ACQKLP_11985 [Chitinophaga sp. NPDC101104]|uniref:hypothetical protein n=1 Tax=Chitinophaga sp. NPDC101104 TaxID=3390561 RepID=UPI003D058CEF